VHIYPHLPVYIYPHFWAEAISTSTYLTNIQPSSALQGGIPFERLCGKMHVYSNLHGCVTSLDRKRTKLTAQSTEGVFLGYRVEHKGYHCRIQWLIGCGFLGMFSLMRLVLSILGLRLMFPLHLWLILLSFLSIPDSAIPRVALSPTTSCCGDSSNVLICWVSSRVPFYFFFRDFCSGSRLQAPYDTCLYMTTSFGYFSITFLCCPLLLMFSLSY
jgi:hypothetical protein